MRFFVLTFILSTLSAFSVEVERDVIVRNEKDKLVLSKLKLQDLLSDKVYEGKYFKIVYKTTNELIKIDDSPLSNKAANVYYHLTIAKNYFEKLGYTQEKQMVVRMEIENAYHKLYHFQNAKLKPIFNNASTVAAGSGDKDLGIGAWENEIWFRPSKRVKLTKQERKKFKQLIRASMPKTIDVNTDVLFFTAANAAISSDFVGSLENSGKTLFQNFLISSSLKYAMPELFMIFANKKIYFEAAFVPEVIYHEYTHYAIADFVPPIDNTAFLEGYADFFAVMISNRSEIAHKLGKYGTLVGSRSALSKTAYSPKLDTDAGLGSDFTLSVFYEIQQMLQKREGKEFADRLMFDLRKKMNLDTKIKDLPIILKNAMPKKYQLETLIILNNRGI